MARNGGRARRAGSGARRARRIVGIGLTGQMHGLVALDSGRPRDPAGDPLERPANRCRVRRDRGADRPRTADLADREPRADRVHGAEAPLAAPPRAGLLSPDRPDHAAEGLRPAQAHRRVGDRRRRRVGTLLLDVAARTWSNEVLDALELPADWLPPVLESPEVSGVTIAGDTSHKGFRSRPGRATAPPLPSAWGSTVPGRSRS